MVRWGTAAMVSLIPFVASCTFFRFPDRLTGQAKAREMRMPIGLDAIWESTRCFEDGASDEDRGCLRASQAPLPSMSFLHVSDAQIRDQRVFEASFLDMVFLSLVDSVIGPTLRRSMLEQYDSVALAAFLAAEGKTRAERSEPRFAIHTGDLLDLSVASELGEGLEIFRRASREGLTLYSVAGNHDGMIFGNMGDLITGTHGIGVNRAEFVLAHLLADKGGYGFDRNEILQKARDCAELERQGRLPRSPGWWSSMESFCRAYEASRNYHDRFAKGGWDKSELDHPIALKAAINVSGDLAGLRVGYYDWSVQSAANGPRVRFIVLDTRSSLGQGGRLDAIQAGWLFATLHDAYQKCEPVIVFAHHGPDEVAARLRQGQRSSRRADAARLLNAFPNVLAYFYGHGHVNREHRWGRHGMAAIQTGSTVDYPNVGRDVRLYVEPVDPNSRAVRATIAWEFVRPRGLRTGADGGGRGFALQVALDELRDDARKDWGNALINNAAKPLGLEKKARLSEGPIRQDVSWGDDPVAYEVFGDKLGWVQDIRKRLNLTPIPEQPARWCSVSVK